MALGNEVWNGSPPAIGAGEENVLPQAPFADEIAESDRRAPDAGTYLRSRRREIVADMAARLLAGQDADDELLPFLYRALAAERIVDASIGFVVTDDGDGMKLAFAKGFPDSVIRQCITLDFGQAICGTVAKTCKAMHVTDIQRSLNPLADLVRSAGVSAYACQPLIVGDRLLGTLSFASRTRRSFDSEDLQFFRTIAKYVAIARERSGEEFVPATAS
ncbi:MAG TPA: GAF domain-containing protein [Sphingomicrobium sp.]|nr:GAF domain-containing protein [Sphingomicrobium sp.]